MLMMSASTLVEDSAVWLLAVPRASSDECRPLPSSPGLSLRLYKPKLVTRWWVECISKFGCVLWTFFVHWSPRVNSALLTLPSLTRLSLWMCKVPCKVHSYPNQIVTTTTTTTTTTNDNNNKRGGASEVKGPGHFEVRKSASQVTRIHFFPQKSWRLFLVVAIKTQAATPFYCENKTNKAVRYGNIFIFCSHY